MGINSLDDFTALLSGGASYIMNSRITGSCLCGGVSYSITGCPLKRNVCHCTNCQKGSGSAFTANSFFMKDQVTISGQERLRTYIDKNLQREGAELHRQFCGDCGSPLFALKPELKDKIVVTVGSMDVDHQSFEPEWRPDMEVFVERKRGFLTEGCFRREEGK